MTSRYDFLLRFSDNTCHYKWLLRVIAQFAILLCVLYYFYFNAFWHITYGTGWTELGAYRETHSCSINYMQRKATEEEVTCKRDVEKK